MINKNTCFYSMRRNLCIIFIVVCAWSVSAQAEQKTLLKEHLKQFEGQVLYVDFWASWCAPCKVSFPWMQQMQEKYADQGFKVIAINLDKQKESVEKFLKQYPANFQVEYDPQGAWAAEQQVKGMPHAFLIDRAGKLRHQHIGFHKKKRDAYEEQIKSLVEEQF